MARTVKGEGTVRAAASQAINLGRSSAGQVMAHALNQLRLALSEVRIVARKVETTVVQERVVNPDALKRASRRYTEAAHAIGTVRQAAGLTHGEQKPEPRIVEQASEHLETMRRELDRLRGLAE